MGAVIGPIDVVARAFCRALEHAMRDPDDPCNVTDTAIRTALISSAEPPEVPSSRSGCYSCRATDLAQETEGWKLRTCRPCWELAGEPGKEPAQPVLDGIREARARGWR